MARNVLSYQLVLTIVILCLLGTFVEADRNFYQILDIQQNAEQGEVKKAYKSQARKYHPDKNPGDEEAASKFSDIARAYEVLNDPEKRQIYDQMGEEQLERIENGGDHRQKGPNHKVTIKASLEELYVGAHASSAIKRNVYCSKCKGSGAHNGEFKTCPKCQGRGQYMQEVNMGIMRMQTQQICPKCQGKGKTFKHECHTCGGHRLVQESKSFEVNVEKGMKNGDTVVFERQGEQVPDQIQGDITFVIQQKPHKTFRRVGDNLYMNLDISLQEALLGFEKTVMHLDGHEVKIANKPGSVSQPFSWLILQKEGMPIKDSWSYGDLHVKLIVSMPQQRLNQRQKDLVEQMFPQA